MTYGDIPPSVEGSTECGGTIPRGASPAGWSRHTRLIPTHEVGITHTLEHGRKYWHYLEKSSPKRPLAPWGGCHLYGSVYPKHPAGCGMFGIYGEAVLRSSTEPDRSGAAQQYTANHPASAHTSVIGYSSRQLITTSNGICM